MHMTVWRHMTVQHQASILMLQQIRRSKAGLGIVTVGGAAETMCVTRLRAAKDKPRHRHAIDLPILAPLL